MLLSGFLLNGTGVIVVIVIAILLVLVFVSRIKYPQLPFPKRRLRPHVPPLKGFRKQCEEGDPPFAYNLSTESTGDAGLLERHEFRPVVIIGPGKLPVMGVWKYKCIRCSFTIVRHKPLDWERKCCPENIKVPVGRTFTDMRTDQQHLDCHDFVRIEMFAPDGSPVTHTYKYFCQRCGHTVLRTKPFKLNNNEPII